MSEKINPFKQLDDQIGAGHALESDHSPTVLVRRSDGTITTGRYTGRQDNEPGMYDVVVDDGVNIKPVPPDVLTDEYQAKLAEEFAADRTPSPTPDKYNLKPGDRIVTPQGRAEEGESRKDFSAASKGIGRSAVAGLLFIEGVPDHIMNDSASSESNSANPAEVEAQPSVEDQIDALVEGLSESDKSALFNYARYLDDKRWAQQAGNGISSEQAGQGAGQEFRKMSPDAQALASKYVRLRGLL